jgi:glycosyltransferase involved in cell wall biosynthesis
VTFPSISVAVPAYNEEAWIAEALESILAQTRPPDEVIVVDDGSTDDTTAVAQRFGERVRVIRQENAGCPAAFNRAFREATGDYVALCPADDVWEPEKLEWQSEVIARRPEVDVVFGGAHNFGVVEDEFPAPSGRGVLDSGTLLRELYFLNLIADPSAVVRRALHERLGGYREALAEDYDFWLRALREGAVFYYDPRRVVRLRQHDTNLSRANPATVWEANHEIHKRYADDVGDPGLVRRTLARDLVEIGRARAAMTQVRESRDAFRASLRQRPSAVGALGALALSLPGAGAAIRTIKRLR